jgi:hypothetical protein
MFPYSRGQATNPQSHTTIPGAGSTTTTYIKELQFYDIVCGRGVACTSHPGNEAFRELVKRYQMVYVCCSKRSDKPKIVMKLLDILRSCGVRFVRRHVKTVGAWEELDSFKAYGKVCQALREKAPYLQRQMIAASLKKEKETTVIRRERMTRTSDKENYSPSSNNKCI